MRLVHTSDWHLGQTLHDRSRDVEHHDFLKWLVRVLVERQVDALLIAGDVFDGANPPASAQKLYYDFLAEVAFKRPGLSVVIVGGNHDSADRLDAPAPLLRALNIHVVGGLRVTAAPESALVGLKGPSGEIEAWVAAVPFLRPVDLPSVVAEDALIEGMRARYAAILGEMRGRATAGQALIAMGHAYLVGGQLSERSERRILGGNQHALPADLFPEWLTYTALGHLHRPQTVAGRQTLRYCGSPIPLSLDERSYPHQVCVIDVDGEVARIEAVQVPRTVELMRVPREGALPPAELVVELRKLPPRPPGMEEARRPWLEVAALLTEPTPTLSAQVLEALEGKAPRLARLDTRLQGDGRALAESTAATDLRELTPQEVFARKYEREYKGDPPEDLRRAFDELLEAAQEAL